MGNIAEKYRKCKCGNNTFKEYSKEKCLQEGVWINNDYTRYYDYAETIEACGNGIDLLELKCEACGEEFPFPTPSTVADKPDKPTVFILISGGNMQAVWSTLPDVEVKLVDQDNGECDEHTAEDNNELTKSIELGMSNGSIHAIY